MTCPVLQRGTPVGKVAYELHEVSLDSTEEAVVEGLRRCVGGRGVSEGRERLARGKTAVERGQLTEEGFAGRQGVYESIRHN